MPLDREHMTRASRVMLPTYCVFFAAVGLNYLLTPPKLLVASPALAYADRLLSLQAWGALFASASVLMAVALVRRNRDWFVAALAFCGLSMAVWAAVLIAAYLNGDASPAGWTYPAFVTAACYASYRSLTARESQS